LKLLFVASIKTRASRVITKKNPEPEPEEMDVTQSLSSNQREQLQNNNNGANTAAGIVCVN